MLKGLNWRKNVAEVEEQDRMQQRWFDAHHGDGCHRKTHDWKKHAYLKYIIYDETKAKTLQQNEHFHLLP